MRIAILTNAFPPLSYGGAGTIAHTQAAWLVRHGHEVKVWVPSPFPDTENDFNIQAFAPRTSVPFAKLSHARALTRLFFHFEDLAPNLWAVDQIRAWNPDILLTHNLTGCGWGTPSMLQKSGLRWMHILHDVQMFEPSGQILASRNSHLATPNRTLRVTSYKLQELWREFWSQRRAQAFGHPDLAISPSQWLLEAHQAYGLLKGCKAQILVNPIDFPDGFCETNIREKSKVIFLGRLAHDKGTDLLVRAWRSFEPRLGSLALVNDGPLASTIAKLEDPSIEITGFLSHDEAMARLYSSNLLVMPSLVMENQPTVLLEAIAAGLNVVATDVGGVRELLDGYGTIVEPGNVEALARAIKSALFAEPQIQLRERILDRHNLDKVMGEMVRLMSSFTDQTKSDKL